MAKYQHIFAVLLTAIGWTIGSSISLLMSKPNVAPNIFSPAGWIISGLITAAAVYWVVSSMRWFQALIIFIGWSMSWSFGQGIGMGLGLWMGLAIVFSGGMPEMGTRAFIIGMIVGMAIAGILGGVVLGVVLRWSCPSVRWSESFIIAIGWSIACAIGGTISWCISQNTLSPIGWGISGAVGSGIMFWRLGKIRLLPER